MQKIFKGGKSPDTPLRGWAGQNVLLRFFSAMKDKTHAIEVGRRLRETAWELGYRSQQELADWLGATRPQVYTWYRGLALPPVKYMQQFAERGVDLDWIYSGDPSGLSAAMYIRLAAAMEEGKPLPDVAQEPESEPDLVVSAYPSRKVQGYRAQPERPKRARAV